MISIPAGARILLAIRPVDFRKGAHTLAALAQEVLGQDPFSGAVIVYRAKRSDRIKILVWDTSGLVLVWKQLQQGVSLAADCGRCDEALARRVRCSLRRARLDTCSDNKGDSQTHWGIVGFASDEPRRRHPPDPA